MNNKIILLTGPGGSGKSTVAQLLSEKYNYSIVDGDQLDTEFFSNGNQWLSENEENLQKAHDKILHSASDLFNSGKNVVIDYIIFGDYLNFIERAKAIFGQHLLVRVLFPSEEATIKRDEVRPTWTTGVERIKQVRAEFQNIKEQIGKDNFVDTSDLTPEEVAERIVVK